MNFDEVRRRNAWLREHRDDELCDFALDVVHLPECLTCVRRPGVWRRKEEARGAFAELVDHAARHLLAGFEAELLLVELAGARNVFRGNIGV